jgi:hypothetical protein
MQRAALPSQSLDDKFNNHPAYQFCVRVEALIEKVTVYAHKYTKHPDDLDIIREDVKSLRSSLELIKPSVTAFEAQRKPAMISSELENRRQRAIRKLVQAEENLQIVSTAASEYIKNLQTRYKQIETTIRQLETTPEAAKLAELERKLAALEHETASLAKRQESLHDIPGSILSFLSISRNKQQDDQAYPYIDAELRQKNKQIHLLKEQIKKINDHLNITTLRSELADIDETLLHHDQESRQQIQQAQEAVDYAKTKALNCTIDITRIILENNSKVSDVIMYSLLRVYVRLLNLLSTIQLTYTLISNSDKKYIFNSEDENPRKRIRFLNKLVSEKIMESFETTFGILSCPRSGFNTGVNIHEHYETLEQATKDKFLAIDPVHDTQEIPSELMEAILPVDEALPNHSFLTGPASSSLFTSQNGRMKQTSSRQMTSLSSVFETQFKIS